MIACTTGEGYAAEKYDTVKNEKTSTTVVAKKKYRVIYKHKVTEYKKTFYIT